MGRSVDATLRSAPRFVIKPEQIQNDTAVIYGQNAHKILHVLRMKQGDDIALLDNSGSAYLCRIEQAQNDVVTANVLYCQQLNTESNVDVTICQALTKGDKLDGVIRQNTEVGASKFIIMKTNRCIVELSESKALDRIERWSKIAETAAEQSFRAFAPSVEGIYDLRKTLSMNPDSPTLFFYEGQAPKLKTVLESLKQPSQLRLLIGPEGGFDKGEVDLAEQSGALPTSLGSRILRTETAALVALSQILYHYDT